MSRKRPGDRRGGVPQARPGSQPGHTRIVSLTESLHIGPLPAPDDLRTYEEVLPGAADRILRLAERSADRQDAQLHNRHALEQKRMDSSISMERSGQLVALVVVIVFAAGGFYLVATGKNVQGFVSMIAPLASLLGVFIYARRVQAGELAKKWRQLLEEERRGRSD